MPAPQSRSTSRSFAPMWLSCLLVLLLSPFTASAVTLIGPIGIRPAAPTIKVGETIQLTANGRYSPDDGTTQIVAQAKQISVGFAHICAVSTDDSVRCWGGNDYGQLGNGTTYGASIPVVVSGISNAASVSTGNFHSCALLTDRTIKCWGSNSEGQLASGGLINSAIPIAIEGVSNAVAVSAGGAHSCALLADGTIKCWGRNGDSVLGFGSVPVTISGINTAVAVSAGFFHTCALLSDGSLRCWGLNSAFQLGDGTAVSSAKPVTVSGVSNAVAISAGNAFSCAVLADGALRCWGDNNFGQLGNGTTNRASTAVAVNGINTAVSVDTGGNFTCASLADGTIKCWGFNAQGTLGNGTNTNSLIPVSVSGINTVANLSAGQGNSCATLVDGTVQCWGDNGLGQLGNATKILYSTIPAKTLDFYSLPWRSDISFASVDLLGRLKGVRVGTSDVSIYMNGYSVHTFVTVSAAAPPPVIDGFWPGDTPRVGVVFVFGNNFVPLKTQVQVNGIAAAFVQAVDPTLLFFMVPLGDTQGPITVTTPNGTATSSRNFGTPLTGLQITGLWPSVTSANQLVILFGAGFVPNATTVKIGNVEAPVRQVLDSSLMFFLVPPSATTGVVTVTTSTGSASSASLLTIR